MPKTICAYCIHKEPHTNPSLVGAYWCKKFKIWSLDDRKRLCNGKYNERKEKIKAEIEG